MNRRFIFDFGVLVLLSFFVALAAYPRSLPQSDSLKREAGESRTLLPDGRLLVLGGQTDAGLMRSDAFIQNLDTGMKTTLPSVLNYARAWHSATVLPSGKVLILGGFGADGNLVAQPELFDPQSQLFSVLSSPSITPRAFHTATLLTDGRLWIAGGVSSEGQLVASTELWNPQQGGKATASAKLSSGRRNHSAVLLPDGRVLVWGGKGEQGDLARGEVFDPVSQKSAEVDNPQALLKFDTAMTELRASSPEDNATDVPVDALISMRFSRPLAIQSINGRTVMLEGPTGTVDAAIIGAENGMLAFITPSKPLVPATTYSVTFSGGTDTSRSPAAFAQFMFTTAGEAVAPDQWIPTADWRTDRPDSKWQSLPALHAPPGITALAGQVLKLDGNPLAGVSLIIDGQKALSDSTGRFLLKNITAGHHVLKINATTANTRTRAYGIYEAGVDIKASQTNTLSYTIWMTPLDTAHTVIIPSPTLTETVITSPLIPGLELHLPANTVITGDDGHVVTQINITPIPLDRPPFPLPRVPVPIYFTIQPGSSYIAVNSSSGPQGAQLFYPNAFHFPPGTEFNFWNYNADGKGWFVYGQGRVSLDGSQVVPNSGVVLYQFTGAMVSNPTNAPVRAPHPGDRKARRADPVDMSTGLFVYTKTDLSVPDVIPITLTRTYRPGDSISRAFGIGTTHPYDMFMVGSNNTTPGGGFIWQDLILADGGRVHFQRTSPCTGPNGYCDFTDAVYSATSTPTSFYGATLRFADCAAGAGSWTMTKKDGTVFCFPDSDGSFVSQAAAPISMTDRYGNTLTFVRPSNGNLTQLISPNGRSISFSYDSSNRVTQAQDHGGRIVKYVYDAGGRLAQVTDPNGGVTNYTYDAFNEMLTIQDARGISYLTNQYDSAGRVVTQTQADNSTFQFAYTTDPVTGNITQTDLTDPRGTITRTTFDVNGYTASTTFALGKLEQQTTIYTNDPNTNLVNSVIDALGRETDYTYDAMGNIASVTTMAKTTAAATSQFTYDATFNQLASVTDPLNHTTTYQRDPATGNLTAIIDPLGHQTTWTYFGNGQVKSTMDAMQNTVQFGYDSGDLTSITDPMGNTTTTFRDVLGRAVAKTDALGNTTRFAYNPLNLLLQTVDPRGGVTNLAYDANGNLLSLTDALNHTTTWTYDNMDRVATRTDPLQRQESFTYDSNGNIVSNTDRKGLVTSLTYDSLNRLKFAGYHTVVNGGNTTYESTTAYSYDAGNRTTQAVDSAGGTITTAYDDVNRVVTEATGQGSISYGYDSASRQTTMTVAGEPQISYAFDNANRLTRITQGTSSVAFTYDNANRRTSLTLPNGVSVSYGFDNDSHTTGITYNFSTTTLGNLTYSYDQLGRRTQVGGSFARTNLPGVVNSAVYDAANELNAWNGTAISYDANGNMQSDGTNSFTWNSRNQVATLNGAGLQYDATGRRTKNATGTSFLFDGPNATQELSGSTLTANILTGGLDEVFQRSDSSGTVVPLADALGTIIALANSSGSIVTTYSYDPFGNTTTAGAANANRSQYTGRENEGSGLYFYRARYYSPLLGRFINEDPVGSTGSGVNLYAYAGDSPTNSGDPFGLQSGDVGQGPTPEEVAAALERIREAQAPLDAIYNAPPAEAPDVTPGTLSIGGTVSVQLGTFINVQASGGVVVDAQ